MELAVHKPVPTTENVPNETTTLSTSDDDGLLNKRLKPFTFGAGALILIASLLLLRSPPPMEGASSTCVDIGPPYLLTTMHGGAGKRSVNNVVKFSRNGCTLSTSVLEESEEVNLRELRGLALLPSGSLIVLNAYRLDTQALLYGSCSPDDHTTRPFTGRILDHGSEKKKKQQKDTAPTATTGDSDNGDDDALDPLLVHSYGLAVNAESTRVFVSNQDTCSVTSSSVLGNEPDEILALRFSPCGRRDDDFDDDAVSSTDDGDSSMSRLRGIALDSKGLLYIAHQEDGLLVYDLATSTLLGSTECESCTGVYFHAATDTIFSGSETTNTVNQFVPWPSLERVASFGEDSDGALSHPAGIAAHGDSLFVVSQDKNLILEFDIPTATYKGTAVAHTPEGSKMEDLIIAPC